MPLPPAPPPEGSELSVSVWNLMGGLDWNALEVVAEMLGVRDIDRLVRDLVTMRDHFKAEDSGGE